MSVKFICIESGKVCRGGLVSLVLVALHAAEISVAEAMMLCANKSEF